MRKEANPQICAGFEPSPALDWKCRRDVHDNDVGTEHAAVSAVLVEKAIVLSHTAQRVFPEPEWAKREREWLWMPPH